MHRLSIIIPFDGNVGRLEDTLVSVLQNRPNGAEILVIHGTPYGDPYHLSGEVRFVAAPRGADQVQCTAVGIAASQAPLVNILGCGVEVGEGWAEPALRHFCRTDVASVSPLVVDRDHPGQVLSTGVTYGSDCPGTVLGRGCSRFQLPRSAFDVVGPTSRAGFYRKSAVDAVPGGLDTLLGAEMAAVDLAATLKRVGWSAVFEPQAVVLDRDGELGKPARGWKGRFRQGFAAERLFRRQLTGRPTRPARYAHALEVLTQAIPDWPWRVAAELFGRIAAAFDIKDYTRFHERLAQVQRAVAQQVHDARSAIVQRPAA